MTKAAAISPYGSIVLGSVPKTVDLPAYAEPLTACVSIDVSNGAVSGVRLLLTDDVNKVFFTWAATEAELLTQLVDDDTRGTLLGQACYDLEVGAFDKYLGLCSADSAVVDGLSYFLVRR